MAANLNSWVAARDGLLVTDKTGWQLGWTIGAGAELALDRNWTVKLDYLYYDLGTDRVSGNVGPTVHSFDIGHTGHMARVGINYRF